MPASSQRPIPGESNSIDSDPLYDGVRIYKNGDWKQPMVEPGDWTTRVADILLSENLVVLTGLGTSLNLNSSSGRLAPTMGDLWRGVSCLDDFKSILEIVRMPSNSEDVEVLLSRCQLTLSLDDSNQALKRFVDSAEKVIFDQCNFPTEDQPLSIHEMFLRKVARRSIRQPRMRLFTTNYDLCFERAASRAGFITIDGFSHTSPQVFDGSYFSYDFVRRDLEGTSPDFIPSVFQLLKLHGSVDWVYTSNGSVVKGAHGKKAMIFPRYGKFESSYQQPYFEMMARLQSALRQPNTGLLIIGYGCHDQHINEPLVSAIRANVGMKLALIDPGLSTESDNPVHQNIRQLIDSGDMRLMLIASRFEEFTKHIPDLVAQTELEAHVTRTRGR